MVFTRKDVDFHGRTVSLPEGTLDLLKINMTFFWKIHHEWVDVFPIETWGIFQLVILVNSGGVQCTPPIQDAGSSHSKICIRGRSGGVLFDPKRYRKIIWKMGVGDLEDGSWMIQDFLQLWRFEEFWRLRRVDGGWPKVLPISEYVGVPGRWNTETVANGCQTGNELHTPPEN